MARRRYESRHPNPAGGVGLAARAKSLAVLVAGALLLVACGGSGQPAATTTSASPPGSPTSTSSTATSSAATSPGGSASAGSAEEGVRTAWELFFDGNLSPEEEVAHLQNGAQFQQVIEGQAGSQLARSTAATVSDVVVNGSRATVTYTVTLGGVPALTDQRGEAVLEDGVWKVSDASFCQLLVLESGGDASTLPPACASASAPATASSAATT